MSSETQPISEETIKASDQFQTKSMEISIPDEPTQELSDTPIPDKKTKLQKVVLVPQNENSEKTEIPTKPENPEYASSPYFNRHIFNKAAEILDKEAGLREERLRVQELPQEKPEDMDTFEAKAATPEQVEMSKPLYQEKETPTSRLYTPGQFDAIQQIPTETLLEHTKTSPTGSLTITETGVTRAVTPPQAEAVITPPATETIAKTEEPSPTVNPIAETPITKELPPTPTEEVSKNPFSGLLKRIHGLYPRREKTPSQEPKVEQPLPEEKKEPVLV